MDSRFYDAFEDRFRGPRELIRPRLQISLSFVNPLRRHLNSVAANQAYQH